MQATSVHLSQNFDFVISLQSIEISNSNTFELLGNKLVVYSKKGSTIIYFELSLGAAKQQIHSFVLGNTNTQALQGYVKIDLGIKLTIGQKLVEKEKGAGFGESVFKLLFYLQHLNQPHFLGQSSINLAYYPNANITQLMEKKFMTSTNDKRAALYFDIQANPSGEMASSDKPRSLQIEASEGSLDQVSNQFQTPLSNLSYRGKSLEKDQFTKLKPSSSQQETNENVRKKASKVIKIGQHTKTKTTVDGAKTSRVRSPPNSSVDRGFQNSANPKSKTQLKPRPNSPQPQPMPFKELHADPQEAQLQVELNEIDRRIHTKRVEPQKSTALESELTRTVNLLREENDRLRDQLPTEQLVRKQMQQQLQSKNQEILNLRHKIEELTIQNLDLTDKLQMADLEKSEIEQLLQKLRFESDQSIQQIAKLTQENKKLQQERTSSASANDTSPQPVIHSYQQIVNERAVVG